MTSFIKVVIKYVDYFLYLMYLLVFNDYLININTYLK